ncbi:MAG: SLOG family protein [Bacteroidota bacterium]
MVKLSVLGTRDFNDYELLKKELHKEAIDVIVVGGKSGPDILAQEFALEMGIQTQVFLPDYKRHGKSANYQRNLEMIRNSTRIVVFWNKLSESQFNYIPYIKEMKRSFRTVFY